MYFILFLQIKIVRIFYKEKEIEILVKVFDSIIDIFIKRALL